MICIAPELSYVVDNEECETTHGGSSETIYISKSRCYGSLLFAMILVSSNNCENISLIRKTIGGKRANRKIKTRKITNRLQNKTRKNSYAFSYTPEYISDISIEYVYSDIRFRLFPHINHDKLISLFITPFHI